MINPGMTSSLSDWLVAGAPPRHDFSGLVGEVGRRLVSAGMELDWFGIHLHVIHPEIPARLTYWTPAAEVKTATLSPEQIKDHEAWVGSPAEVCLRSGRMVIYTVGASPEFDCRADMQALADRGYEQFVCTPLHSTHSLPTHVARYGTKRKGGFTQEDIVVIRTIQAPLARLAESHSLYEGTVQILSTYVGRDAGNRVLRGNILRGDTETIPSIILFADLKSFSALSNTSSAQEILDMLNTFYDVAEVAIRSNGGEILKFIGDGMLAIFQTPDDMLAQKAASVSAILALQDMRDALDRCDRSDIQFRASLHLGDIHYGSIGTKSRMDFTAVGPSVNLTSRLLDAAAELNIDIVCSEAFHNLVPHNTDLLGDRTLKGFDTPERIFRVRAPGSR
jgi:adenylate cyclase